MPLLSLKPSVIHYTQENIGCKFQDGNNIGKTLDDLMDGVITMDSFRFKLRVCHENGKWWSEDNRRLWVFKHLERLGKYQEIVVQQKASIRKNKMTTVNGGTSIRVRGHIEGRWYRAPGRARYNPTPIVRESQSYSGGDDYQESLRQLLNDRRIYEEVSRLSYVQSTPRQQAPPPPPKRERKSDSWCAIL